MSQKSSCGNAVPTQFLCGNAVPMRSSPTTPLNVRDSFVRSFLCQMKELQSQVLGVQRHQQQLMFQSF